MRRPTLESAAAGSFKTSTSLSNEGKIPSKPIFSPLSIANELAYVVAMRSFASTVCEAVKMNTIRAKSEQAPAVFTSHRARSGIYS